LRSPERRETALVTDFKEFPMRLSLSLSLALSLLAVPAARAEVTPPAAPVVAAVQPAVASAVPSAPELKLREVRVPTRAHDRSSAADPFQRGSFWWTVGVIVVAGVILAILL
jgi:hypothetical protein